MRWAVRAAVGLLVLDLIFSVARFLVYDEPESVLFGVVDVFVLALLAVGSVRGRSSG